MFKRYLALVLLLTFSAPAISSLNEPAAQKAAFNSEGIKPSDEILEFMSESVKDCLTIRNQTTRRLTLCSITLKHYDACLDLFRQKEAFIPEKYRTYLPTSQHFIALMNTDGTPFRRISPDQLQGEVFNSLWQDDQLKQITLYMILQRFRLLCQVLYLNEGAKHVPDFTNYKAAEVLAISYRMTAPELADKLKEKTDEEILDEMLAEHTFHFNFAASWFFHLMMGVSGSHFMEGEDNKTIFVLPELEFQNEPSVPEDIHRMKSYAAFQMCQISNFKLRLVPKDLDVIAPLPDLNWRRDHLNKQQASGRFIRMDGNGKRLEDQTVPDITETEVGLIFQARFAKAAADKAVEEKIEPLQQLIKSLEKAIAIQQETIATNEAHIKKKEDNIEELQRRIYEFELLEEERTGKPKPKQKDAKGEPNQAQLTEKLKAKQVEIKALNAKVKKLQEELQRNEKIIGNLKGNTTEFLALYNRQNETQRLMKEELDKLTGELTRLKELAKECEDERLARMQEVESLKADNDNLRSKLTLIEETHVALEKKDDSGLADAIHSATAALAKAALERAQLEAENTVLAAKNDEFIDMWLRAEKSGVQSNRMAIKMMGFQIDNERLHQETLHYRGKLAGLKLELHMLKQRCQAEHANAAHFYNDNVRLTQDNVRLTQQLTLTTSQLLLTTQQRDNEYQLRLKQEKEIKELKDAASKAEGSSN